MRYLMRLKHYFWFVELRWLSRVMVVRWTAPQEKTMSEIHSDDGGTVEKLGREPWDQIDWTKIFELTTGKRDLPLSAQTLAQVLSTRYDCTPGLAREILQLAVNHGELLSLEVTICDMSWNYYFNKQTTSGARRIELIVSAHDFYNGRTDLTPEPVSREDLKSIFEECYSGVDADLIGRVIEHMRYMEPVLLDEDGVHLHPALARYVLLKRSHEAIHDAIAPCDTTEEGPAFERVLRALGEYNEAENDLQRR